MHHDRLGAVRCKVRVLKDVQMSGQHGRPCGPEMGLLQIEIVSVILLGRDRGLQ